MTNRASWPRRGRPREEDYERAYQKLQEGVSYEQAYQEWLSEHGWAHDPQLRDNFRKAMSLRQKKTAQQ
jgi:hypothetical protein